MLKFILPLAFLAMTACVPAGPDPYAPGANLQPGECYFDSDGYEVCS